MKCGFCGYEFDPAQANTACGSCPLVRGCPLVRCPHCGYEMPPEAKLIGWLRKLRNHPSKQQVSSVKESSERC